MTDAREYLTSIRKAEERLSLRQRGCFSHAQCGRYGGYGGNDCRYGSRD